LMGEPNAGKSSLFNALVRRFGTGQPNAGGAIVSNQRGTTRDYLIANISVHGTDCELIDTVGIEDLAVAANDIDTSARELSLRQRNQAIVRIHCIDSTTDLDPLDAEGDGASTIVALTKCDLLKSPSNATRLATSCVTGAGLDQLRDAILSRLSATRNDSRSNFVAATADRCRDSLRLAGDALTRASQLAFNESGEELVAAEVRAALAEIGKVVGAVYTDDLLDRIFKTFCIGK
jgi:tRNA modification GTPase